MSIVHCPPVTMAIIRRPHPTFQLGFSVEDGIVSTFGRAICFFSFCLQRRLTLNDLKPLTITQNPPTGTWVSNVTISKSHLLRPCGRSAV